MNNMQISYSDYITLFVQHARGCMHINFVQHMLLYCDFNFYYSNGVSCISLVNMALSDAKCIKTCCNVDVCHFDVHFEELAAVKNEL